MLNYLRLLRPPTPRPLDTAVYALLYLSTAVLAPLMSVLRRRTMRQSISILVSSLMPKDLLIEYMGVRFVARKRKAGLLLLSALSSSATWDWFTPTEGETVLDIGAHVGKYALVAAKIVGPRGKVIAIEPHPENYQALLHNIRLNRFDNVIVLNVAAYHENEKTLRLFGQWDTAYTVKAWHPSYIKVPSWSVDSILKEHCISTVDWAKVDVEGAEAEVLTGMKETIRNSPSLRVLAEVTNDNDPEVSRILSGFSKRTVAGSDQFYWKE